MNDQTQEMREYIKFWTKFSQKAEEILHEYNNLSDENKKDASVTGSGNFGKFIKLFESDDNGWIEEINTNVEFDK